MPVYLLFGEEDYLLDKEITSLKRSALGSDINAMNYLKHDNPNAKQLHEILLSNPMLFGNTMHIINLNKTLIANQKGGIPDSEIDNIVKDIEFVNNNVYIVFLCRLDHGSKKRPDQRKKLFKTISKIGTVKEFAPQFRTYEDWKYTKIIQDLAYEKEIEVSKDVAKCLVDTVGVYLIDINSQLEKLKLYAHPNKKITLDMVKEISVVNEDIFTLVDLILENKTEDFLNKVLNLLEKSHYLEIIALLQTSIGKLLQTKVYSKKYSISEIARLLGQKDKIVEINLNKISNIPTKRIVEIKQNLTIIEYRLKSGDIQDPILAFERMLLGGKLC